MRGVDSGSLSPLPSSRSPSFPSDVTSDLPPIGGNTAESSASSSRQPAARVSEVPPSKNFGIFTPTKVVSLLSPASSPLPSTPVSVSSVAVNEEPTVQSGSDPPYTLKDWVGSLDPPARNVVNLVIQDLANQTPIPKPTVKSPPILHSNAIFYADIPRRTDVDFTPLPTPTVRPARPVPAALSRPTVPLISRQTSIVPETFSRTPGKRPRQKPATTSPNSPQQGKKSNIPTRPAQAPANPS